METLPEQGEESRMGDSSTESPPEDLGRQTFLESTNDPAGFEEQGEFEAFPTEEESTGETEFVSSSAPADNEEFESRVRKLVEMMEADSKVRDRIIAEIYVNIASAEQGIRGVFEMIQSQGVGGFMRGAFRRG